MYRKILFSLFAVSILFSCQFENEKRIINKLDKINFGYNKESAELIYYGPLLITIPKNQKEKHSLTIIFGGIKYANPKFMMDNTPKEYFEKSVLVFAPCRSMGGEGFKNYINITNKILKRQGIKTTKLAVCGFSGGGPDALEAEGSNLKLVGLIDADPDFSKVKDKKYPLIINSYNVKNWGEDEKTKNLFRSFAIWTRNHRSLLEKTKVDHKIYPKYFFYRYRHKFLS